MILQLFIQKKLNTEPSLKKTKTHNIIHLYKYLNMLVLTQVPKPVFSETCSFVFTSAFP